MPEITPVPETTEAPAAKKSKPKTKKPAKAAAKPSSNGDGTHEIRWTPKKVELLKTLVKLGATSAVAAVPPATVTAKNPKALTPAPHYDMTVQGFLSWAVHEDERVHKIYVTKKGVQKLEKLTK